MLDVVVPTVPTPVPAVLVIRAPVVLLPMTHATTISRPKTTFHHPPEKSVNAESEHDRVTRQPYTSSVSDMHFPDRTYITDALLTVEADIHKYGWDRDPILGMLCQQPDGSWALAVASIFDRPKIEPGEFISRLGQTLLRPAAARMVDSMLADIPQPLALVMVAEAWSTQTSASERGYRRAGDMPDAKELRMTSAIDFLGRDYSIWRIRGEEPVDHHGEPGFKAEGRVPEGMRMILLAMARRMPGFEESAKILESLSFAISDTDRPTTRQGQG